MALTLLGMPTEIQLSVAETLPVSGINALIQTNRYFAGILDDFLHQRAVEDIKEEAASECWSCVYNLTSRRSKLGFIFLNDRGPTLTRMIALGFSVNPPNQSTLHRDDYVRKACIDRRPSILNALLDAGACDSLITDYCSESDSLLHVACNTPNSDNIEGLLEVLRILIRRGANVEYQDGFGFTPLQLAINADAFLAVELLLEFNADPREMWLCDYHETYDTILDICRRHSQHGPLDNWEPKLVKDDTHFEELFGWSREDLWK